MLFIFYAVLAMLHGIGIISETLVSSGTIHHNRPAAQASARCLGLL